MFLSSWAPEESGTVRHLQSSRNLVYFLFAKSGCFVFLRQHIRHFEGESWPWFRIIRHDFAMIRLPLTNHARNVSNDIKKLECTNLLGLYFENSVIFYSSSPVSTFSISSPKCLQGNDMSMSANQNVLFPPDVLFLIH